MKTQLLYASIAIAAGLTFVNLYNSLVDVRSWGSDIPASIINARAYFRSVNPGTFFRFFSPLNQLVALVCVILFWKTAPSIRTTLIAALVLYILADVLTFAYFYPRNSILFMGAAPDKSILENVWRQWSRMNWVRTAIVFAGLILSMISLHRSYSILTR
ncbi:MAG TPA: DUF1772 domain-containing protein [Puia sp.]|nr:DUF1772 domain-containing protein [Puia sp.]